MALRNGLVASPGFQRWAAGFPLTRRIAQRNTRALFDLCAGFVYAQVLFACIRLDLFKLLQDGPLAPETIARRVDLPLERSLTLLKAAASLGLLSRLRDGRFALADLADPIALLRGESGATRLARHWPYADPRSDAARVGPDAVAAYSGLMASSQALIAGDVLDALPLAGRTCLMDVGGGEGVFLAHVARRHPGLALRLFDLPPVAERAGARLTAEGLGDRVTCVGGTFLGEPLPAGADAITLVRVIHDHDDAEAMAILRVAHKALPPGGLLGIAEPMAGTAGAEPIGDAYFGFYLLAMGSGRPRTVEELTAMLKQAGFSGIREWRTRRPLLARLLTASR